MFLHLSRSTAARYLSQPLYRYLLRLLYIIKDKKNESIFFRSSVLDIAVMRLDETFTSCIPFMGHSTPCILHVLERPIPRICY